MSCPSRKDKHLFPTILSPAQPSAPGLLLSARKPSPSPPRGPASWLLEMQPQIQSVQSTSLQWLVARSAAKWSEHRERSRVNSPTGKPTPSPSSILPAWERQNTANLDLGLLGAEMCTWEVQLGTLSPPRPQNMTFILFYFWK